MDSTTGNRLSEAKYTELRSGLHRRNQSLHRDAEPGDRLQDRYDQDSRVAGESEKKQLGSKFDIHQFHDVVLTNGALPLDVLEELVDRWIKSKQSGGSGEE